jgi:branched-chain amino acid transport system permease protein
MALLNTPAKRNAILAVLVLALAAPFLLTDDWLLTLARAAALTIGAIGLNLVTGYAGQVSLGHAFFVGIGAYTAAVLTGDPDGRTLGLGLPMVVGLAGAIVLPALLGALVAPVVARLRGLYLAIMTLGLVFLGEHVFREAGFITGGVGVGREGPWRNFFGLDLGVSGMFSAGQKLYWFALIMAILAIITGRNIARGALGRAFAAVRDRDIAAEIIGISLARTKAWAFALSSAYAGLCGAVLYTVLGFLEPTSFNLLLSIVFVAIILIGGAATISGSVLGAVFIAALPRFTQTLPQFLPFVAARAGQPGLINAAQAEQIIYGLLIIVFLIFEPRGLFGIWLRVRNYWKGWPFSY